MSAAGSELGRLVERLPKVELHVHLEGSMRPPILLQLARRRGVSLPADDAAGLRRWFRFRDFDHFVEIYLTCSSCLRDPEDFQLLALDVVTELERQRVLYCEAHFTISTHIANGVNAAEVADALGEVIAEAERRRGVVLRLIPDIVRNVSVERADWTLEWALENRERGVVALGLSGIESFSNEPFREHFDVARREGLHRVAHAGEHGGPESVRSVLEVCGAERIGHGVRAAESPELTTWLSEQRVPLEVCPTSNVCLGVVPALEQHPLPQLVEAGCVVTLNSDDPPLFGTSLNEEYRRVAEEFGWRRETLAVLARNAIEAAFLSPEQRRGLLDRFERELAEIA